MNGLDNNLFYGLIPISFIKIFYLNFT